MPTPKSPAVTAFEIEQATRREEADDLDAGLRATFPASDPVSATAAEMPGGEANRKKVGDEDAPRVDEALNAILAHRDAPYVEPRDRAAALKEEARSLGYRGQNVVSSTRRQIRDQPMRAVALAALFGFVYGMIR